MLFEAYRAFCFYYCFVYSERLLKAGIVKGKACMSFKNNYIIKLLNIFSSSCSALNLRNFHQM